MNSYIISSIVSFGKSFGDKFTHTWIYSIVTTIYTAISRSWKNSAIMGLLRGNKREGEAAKSIAGKIARFPFTLLEFIGGKIGARFSETVKKSRICYWGRSYAQNFIALNTRFFGIMILCLSLSLFLAKYILTGYIIKWLLIAALVGAVLSLFNYNVMRFGNGSAAVNFIKCCCGYRKLSFDFFDENMTKGRTRIVLAAITGIAAGAAAAVSPLIGAAVPFGIAGAVLVLQYPIVGVYAAVFIAPIVPTMVLAGCCLLTGFSFVLYTWTKPDYKWRFEGVGFGIILLLAVLFVSSLFSFAMIGSLKVWAMYLVFAGFYFVIINTIKTKEQLYGLLRLFVISGAFVALYGIMQYVFGWTTSNAWIDETMFEDDTMRVYSTLANPNVLGEYLILVLPVAGIFMLRDKARNLSKWVYIAIFALLALCLVLTQSRGCWIGFVLSLVIFLTFYEGRWWAFIPVVVLFLPLIVPETVVDRVMSIGNMEDSSTSYRVYIWLATLGMLKNYWLGGIGMGEAAFNEVYPFYSYNAIIAPHSHNTFLQLTVEAGIGALIVFIVTQIVFAQKMQSVYKLNRRKSLDSTAALAIGAGIIGFLAQSMFDYTFYNYRVMCIFFMVMALGIALKYAIEEGRELK